MRIKKLKNKQIVSLLICTLYFAISSLTTGCYKSFEEDKGLSWRSARKRIHGEWQIYKIEVNGVDSSAMLDIDSIKIFKYWKFDDGGKTNRDRFRIRSEKELDWHEYKYFVIAANEVSVKDSYRITESTIFKNRQNNGTLEFITAEGTDRYYVYNTNPTSFELLHTIGAFNSFGVVKDRHIVIEFEILSLTKNELLIQTHNRNNLPYPFPTKLYLKRTAS